MAPQYSRDILLGMRQRLANSIDEEMKRKLGGEELLSSESRLSLCVATFSLAKTSMLQSFQFTFFCHLLPSLPRIGSRVWR
ncbi:hypothetical protein MRB53_042236 [Persea americana]|nr:hypothetical protein MRB53_042236 [Persea americana]